FDGQGNSPPLGSAPACFSLDAGPAGGEDRCTSSERGAASLPRFVLTESSPPGRGRIVKSPNGLLPRPRAAYAQDSPADAEGDFYRAYSWCLNPYPMVREALGFLEGEIGRLGEVQEAWQAGEVMTNVYLLSCAVLNAADDYLRGRTFLLPKKLSALP